MLLDHTERQILNYLNLNIDTQNCYEPKHISDNFGSSNDKLDDELKAAKVCSRLYAKGVVDLMGSRSSDPDKLGNCYRINAKGIDELNPSSKNKNLYRLAIIGGICSPIAIVLAIVAIVLNTQGT